MPVSPGTPDGSSGSRSISTNQKTALSPWDGACLITPTFYVLDPRDEHAIATQLGARTLTELIAFLGRGELGRLQGLKTPAEGALARGDDLFAHNRPAHAA
jgi:hypothetical protein